MGRANIDIPDFMKYVDLKWERPGQDVRYAINCHHLIQYGWTPKKEFNNEIGYIVTYYKGKFTW